MVSGVKFCLTSKVPKLYGTCWLLFDVSQLCQCFNIFQWQWHHLLVFCVLLIKCDWNIFQFICLRPACVGTLVLCHPFCSFLFCSVGHCAWLMSLLIRCCNLHVFFILIWRCLLWLRRFCLHLFNMYWGHNFLHFSLLESFITAWDLWPNNIFSQIYLNPVSLNTIGTAKVCTEGLSQQPLGQGGLPSPTVPNDVDSCSVAGLLPMLQGL